jgi:hypothetical protein
MNKLSQGNDELCLLIHAFPRFPDILEILGEAPAKRFHKLAA